MVPQHLPSCTDGAASKTRGGGRGRKDRKAPLHPQPPYQYMPSFSLCCYNYHISFSPPPPLPPTHTDCTASPTVATTDDQLTQYRLCTSITGNLQLGHQDCSAPCTITNLTPLGGVVAMDGSLTIQCCNNLTDLSVFGSLQMVRGSLVVYYNARLATISGFAALTEIVGSVSVSQNQRLSTISGFSSLNLIGGFLSVERNTVLADMNGFRRLGLIRGQSTLSGHALTVIHNTRLSSLTGLSGLTNISYGTVHIEGNTALCYAGYPLWQVRG